MRNHYKRLAVQWLLAAIAIGQPVYAQEGGRGVDCTTVVFEGLERAVGGAEPAAPPGGPGGRLAASEALRDCIADAIFVSSAGRAALALFERGVPEPPPTGLCPGALVWRQGRFHEPQPGSESLRIDVPLTAGERFERLTVDLDVVPGRWFAGRESDNHNLVWINRGGKWRDNVLAYVNLFGPPAPGGPARLKIASNLETGRRMRAASTEGAVELGAAHHLRYVLDAAAGEMTAELTGQGGELRVRERLEAREIVSKKPGVFVVLGHGPAAAGLPEVPTLGWAYENLCVRLEKGGSGRRKERRTSWTGQ